MGTVIATIIMIGVATAIVVLAEVRHEKLRKQQKELGRVLRLTRYVTELIHHFSNGTVWLDTEKSRRIWNNIQEIYDKESLIESNLIRICKELIVNQYYGCKDRDKAQAAEAVRVCKVLIQRGRRYSVW